MSQVDDYWMTLARAALKALLLHDAAQHGYGAVPTRTLDFVLDHEGDINALDSALLNSEDAGAHEIWKEVVQGISRSLLPTMLVIVKTVLSYLPNQLIRADAIPHYVDTFQFEQVA